MSILAPITEDLINRLSRQIYVENYVRNYVDPTDPFSPTEEEARKVSTECWDKNLGVAGHQKTNIYQSVKLTLELYQKECHD